jgi:hypothetical protein
MENIKLENLPWVNVNEMMPPPLEKYKWHSVYCIFLDEKKRAISGYYNYHLNSYIFDLPPIMLNPENMKITHWIELKLPS